jgi:hypothetical protein
MSKDNRFTVAGITTHLGTTASGVVSERTKVRYGTDMIRLVKMLNSPTKIWDRKLDVGLSPVRVELVELPSELTKAEALDYLSKHETFQSADDQFAIKEAQHSRAAKSRASREVKVTATPSLDAIRARGTSKVAA